MVATFVQTMNPNGPSPSCPKSSVVSVLGFLHVQIGRSRVARASRNGGHPNQMWTLKTCNDDGLVPPTTRIVIASCSWHVVGASASFQYVAARTKNDFFGCTHTRYAEPLVFMLRTLDELRLGFTWLSWPHSSLPYSWQHVANSSNSFIRA